MKTLAIIAMFMICSANGAFYQQTLTPTIPPILGTLVTKDPSGSSALAGQGFQAIITRKTDPPRRFFGLVKGPEPSFFQAIIGSNTYGLYPAPWMTTLENQCKRPWLCKLLLRYMTYRLSQSRWGFKPGFKLFSSSSQSLLNPQPVKP